MSSSRLWSRVRKGRLVQVLLVYLGVSWAVVQVVDDLRSMLGLPQWLGPVTIIMLAIGLFIILATAWVQSHPLVDARAAADEVPRSWELDLPEAVASVRKGRLPHLTWSRALLGGVVAFSLLIGVAGLYVLVQGGTGVLRPRQASAAEAPDGIAVLPFTVRGAALEDWREGMVDLLSTGLDGAGGLRAIASRTVLARWHETVPGEGTPDEAKALAVARHVGARYALLGSAVSIGPSVRLAIDVYELDGERARRLGQPVQVEGHRDSVLVLVDQLGLRVLAVVLRESRADLPPIDLARVTTASLPALKSYLDGEALYRRGDFDAAAKSYDQAIAADSLFALAHWRLSQALGWNENFQSPRGREANQRAVQLIDRLPAREALLARAFLYTRDGDLAGIAMLEDAVKRYPDDAEAWYQLADAKYHQSAALVTWEEIEPAFARAVSLAPRMTPYRIHLVEGAFRYHGDSAIINAAVDDFEQFTGAGRQTLRFQIAQQLAFGGAAGGDTLIAVILNPANGNLGALVSTALSHPRFAEIRRQLGDAAYPKVPPPVRQSIARGRGFGHMNHRGQIRLGVEAFRDPALPPNEWRRIVLTLHVAGMPMAPDLMTGVEAEADPRGPLAFLLGAYAATRERWEEHAAAVAALQTRGDSLAGAGDTTDARHARADARLLEGFALWRRGQADEGARIMDAARLQGPSDGGIARWWLGRLHFDAGRWHAARPYFASFNKFERDPLPSYYLAQVEERTGQRAQARGLYAFFIEQWAHADPELQPIVEDARQRLGRLAGEGPRQN